MNETIQEHFIVINEPIDITKVNLHDMMAFLTALKPDQVKSGTTAIADYLEKCGAIETATPHKLEIVTDNGKSKAVAKFEKQKGAKPL